MGSCFEFTIWILSLSPIAMALFRMWAYSFKRLWINTACMWPGSTVTLAFSMDSKTASGSFKCLEKISKNVKNTSITSTIKKKTTYIANSPHIQAAAYSTSHIDEKTTCPVTPRIANPLDDSNNAAICSTAKGLIAGTRIATSMS